MEKKRFSLAQHPWLFLLAFILAYLVGHILIPIILIYVIKLPQSAPTYPFWLNVSNNLLLVFLVAPFVLRFKSRSQSYTDFLSEIRLTRWQPALKLLLLGVSCWLIMALCQIASTLIYRLSQGGPVDLAFFSSAFPLRSEFPPQSLGWFITIIGITEELTFRGVILALFLRFYEPSKAILFSALGFGFMHIFGMLSGADLLWAVGNVVWAFFLGIFYGYVTFKTGSLLPAMLVHYLGNLFIYPLTAYLQDTASTQVVVLYGVILTMGIVPNVLMALWARTFTSRWFEESSNPIPARLAQAR